MNTAIKENREVIIALCKRFKVRRLEIFGDAVNGNEDSQDVGFIVDYDQSGPWGSYDVYFRLESALEAVFGHEVGLYTANAVDDSPDNNPYSIRRVAKTRKTFYEA